MKYKKPCQYELPYPVPYAVAASARTESWISYTYRGSSSTKSALGMGIGLCSFFSIVGLVMLVLQGWGSVTTTQQGIQTPILFLELVVFGGLVFFVWCWRKYNTRFEVTVSLIDGSCRFVQERMEPHSYRDSAIHIIPSKLWNQNHVVTLVVIVSGTHRSIVGGFKDPIFAVGFAEQLAKETGLTVIETEDSDLSVVQGMVKFGGKDAHALENRIQDAPIYV